jgi:hypothetical protein
LNFNFFAKKIYEWEIEKTVAVSPELQYWNPPPRIFPS